VAVALQQLRRRGSAPKPGGKTPCARGETGILLPEKDQPIFLAALAGRATHLLTGDLRHFRQHMNQPEETSGIVIQTVADYLNSL
jgi:hypothetical protein